MSQYTNPNHPAGDLYPRPEGLGWGGKRARVAVEVDSTSNLGGEEQRVYKVLRSRLMDGATLREISEATGFAQLTLARILDSMRSDGLVRRLATKKGVTPIWMLVGR